MKLLSRDRIRLVIISIILTFPRLLCLRIIYNKPHFFDTTTPDYDGNDKGSPDEKSYLSNLDQFDYLDDYDRREAITTRRPYVFTERIKPPVLKVYLKNVTVKAGELAMLKCPLVADENNSNFNEENNPLRMRKQFSKISFRNSDINVDEFYTIKAIIWTHELTPPKLLSNNEELFVKDQRISIQTLDRVEEERNSFLKRRNGGDEISKKEYNLKICPAKIGDKGWYSCSIVRRSWHDQNVKYFIHLNVVESDHRYQRANCELPASKSTKSRNLVASTTPAAMDGAILTESARAMTTSRLAELTLKSPNEIGRSWRHGHSKKLDEVNLDSKPEIYQLNGNRLIMDDTNRLLENGSPITDSTLKRELDKKKNVSLLTSNHDEANQRQRSEKSFFSFESVETDMDDEKEIIFDKIESMKETTALVGKKKLRKPHHTTTLPIFATSTPSIAAGRPSAIVKSRHQPKNQAQMRETREELNVYPKNVKMPEYRSFQLDCVYKGPNYLKVKLIWLKNDQIIQPVNSEEDGDRLFLLNYKQNNTSFCILKFSHALLTDSGVYTCVATISPHHVPNNQLIDSDRVLDFQNNLNDSLSLLIGNSYRSSKENLLKLSSYFDSVESNSCSFDLAKTSYFWLSSILAAYLLESDYLF